MGQGNDRRAVRRLAAAAVIAGGALAVASCSSSDQLARKVDPKYGVTTSPRVVNLGDPVPKGGGAYRVGRPYTIAGRTYTPGEDRDYTAEGLASWYGEDFHGRRTANGEIFDMESLSAAHTTLPMPSYVRVTNLQNHRSVIVRVNDRGPYHDNRVIDVSRRTAHVLGFKGGGVARVRVEYVGPAPLEGSDDRMLQATLRHREPAPAPSAVMLASARPLVPSHRPTQSFAGTSVPYPAERPFTLGERDNSVSAARAPGTAVADRWPQAPSARAAIALAPRSLDQQARSLEDGRLSPAASAYAPPPPAMSGFGSNGGTRGLY
jgi:rare lipoprotein A